MKLSLRSIEELVIRTDTVLSVVSGWFKAISDDKEYRIYSPCPTIKSDTGKEKNIDKSVWNEWVCFQKIMGTKINDVHNETFAEIEKSGSFSMSVTKSSEFMFRDCLIRWKLKGDMFVPIKKLEIFEPSNLWKDMVLNVQDEKFDHPALRSIIKHITGERESPAVSRALELLPSLDMKTQRGKWIEERML